MGASMLRKAAKLGLLVLTLISTSAAVPPGPPAFTAAPITGRTAF